MIDCVILGDSIAVGLHSIKPECYVYAKGGINTSQYNKNYDGEFYSGNVIISLGSNDHKWVNTRQELENLRNRILAKQKVYWILPAGNLKASEVPIENIQKIVKDIAEKNGDVVIPITGLSKDKIHPTTNGYKELAEKTK